MKKLLYILSFFILIILFSGCFLQFKTKNQIIKNDCVYSKDFQLNGLKGQYVMFSFYDNGRPISLFRKFDKSINTYYRKPEFQYERYCVFFHNPYPPINKGEFEFVYKGDTMRITVHLSFKINHFIDSIPFKKGKFDIILDFEEVYKDSLRSKFMKAVYSPSLRDSIQSFYQNYANSRGIDFSEYYNKIQQTENPSNPFKDYFYCQNIQDTIKPKSAENYINDVLNEKFIKIKIKKIIHME